jgi:hypothetical protein
MKWKAKIPPKEGDKRQRFRFAWKPTKVEKYTVWLEFYGVNEVYGLKAWQDKDGIQCREIWEEVDRYIPIWYY